MDVRLVPAAAAVLTGLALYLSRGVLDQVPESSGLMRVALLPPLLFPALAAATFAFALAIILFVGAPAPTALAAVTLDFFGE